MGSRPAGPWAIRSEIPVNDVFYVVDGENYEESFFALSGTIFTSLELRNYEAYHLDTEYIFTINTEHNIPKQGRLRIEFPEESVIPDPSLVRTSKFTIDSVDEK